MVYRVKVSKSSYAFRINIPKRLVKGLGWEKVKFVSVSWCLDSIYIVREAGHEKGSRRKGKEDQP